MLIERFVMKAALIKNLFFVYIVQHVLIYTLGFAKWFLIYLSSLTQVYTILIDSFRIS